MLQRKRLVQGGVIVSYIALILAVGAEHVAAQATEALEQLLSELSERQGFFSEGVIEVRQSVWRLPEGSADASVRPLVELLARTPVSTGRALATAKRMEAEASALLGRPSQTAWAFYHSPAGSRLVEVPLEPGERADEEPRPSRTAGMRVHGFQQGTVACYEQMAGELRLSEGTAEDAFAFRTGHVDPTLERMELLQMLKQGARGVSVSTSGASTLLVRLKTQPPEELLFERVDDGRHVLARRSVAVPGVPSARECFYGNYARFFGGWIAVPASTLCIYREGGATSVSLFTVRKWQRRPVERREIEIRIPPGTKIIRAAADKEAEHDEAGKKPQQGPRVETNP